MNKKIGLLLFLVLLLTGCKANYVIKYENGKFSEHLEIISSENTYNEDEAHPTYDMLKENTVSAINDGTEKWIVDQDSSKYDIKISHNLNKSTLNDLTVFKECFTLNTYKEGNDSIYYSAYGDFRCYDLEEGSSFILETKNQVVDNNATKIEKDKYIWDLKDKGIQKDGIYFQILKDDKELTKKSHRQSELIPWYIKFIVSVIAIAVIIYAITYIKKNS